jgi:hypothetical protein
VCKPEMSYIFVIAVLHTVLLLSLNNEQRK